MAAFVRCGVLKYRNLGQSVIRALSVSKTYGFVNTAVPRYAATFAKDKETLLTEVHRKIDLNIGVSHELFKLLFSSCEQNESVSEQEVALLLHVCSIGPFDSPAKKRSEIADEVWNKLEQLGVTPTTRLYNIKLKVYIANRTPFNPLDELLKVKSLGLNPDKVTYGLLLEGYCQQGDVAGANNVLETMKTSDYLIGVGIFNSFITGHLKAGSPEEAAKVLEVLRSRGLTPDSDTYFRFARHYAEEGDIDSALKYINEAESEGVILGHVILMDLYRTMVTSGHSNKVEPLLKIISERGVYRAASMQKSCQLVSEGFNEAALQLYTVTPKFDETLQHNYGSFLLKAMIINGQSAEAVMNMADKIVEDNVKALPHRNALFYAFKADHTDLAVQLLELMKAKNHEIKVPHIMPAICSYRKTQNKEGLHKVIGMLLELEGAHCIDDKVEGLLKFGYPALTDLKESREDIVRSFKDYEKTWNYIFFLSDLVNGFSTVLKNAAGKELDARLPRYHELEYHWIMNLPKEWAKEWESCIEVLEYLDQQGVDKGKLMTLNAFAIGNSALGKDWDLIDKIATAMQKKGLKLRESVKQLNFYKWAPENVKAKIDQLCVSRVYATTDTVKKLQSLTKEELESYQKEHSGSNNARIALLNKALETSDLDTIKLKVRELQAVGFTLSSSTLSIVVRKLTELGDLETALHYFDELTKAAGCNYRIMNPLGIAIKQVTAGKISDAVKMIGAASKSTFPKDERTDAQKLMALTTMLRNAPTLDDAFTLHSEIFKTTSLVHDNETLQLHAAYIIRVLDENDDDEILARLIKLHESYHVFPCMERVLVRFIEKGDVERLKKVMDLGISVFGSSNFYFKLAICFIQCGHPSKAVTVLQTPGLKFQEKYLVYGCRNFVKSKRIDCLETFVKITKDMPMNRALMLTYLLEGYVAVDDLKKATKVLDEFAEKFFTLPKETASLLVKAYLSHNMAVPEFLQAHIPKVENVSDTIQTSSSSSESDSESSESDREGSSTQDNKDSAKKGPADLEEQKESKKLDAQHSPSSNPGSTAPS